MSPIQVKAAVAARRERERMSARQLDCRITLTPAGKRSRSKVAKALKEYTR